MKKLILLIILMISTQINAQEQVKEEVLPYYEIPEASEKFTAGTVAARQVDALGFRFYHATDGLTEKDLAYKPNEDARSVEETVSHIFDLSVIVLNSTLKKANAKVDNSKMTFEDKRTHTLINLKKAADILRASDDISQFKIIFGDNQIPFWNNINGPIADAIWHAGQIASFRRITENPINPKVNHFRGTVKK